MAIRRQNQIVMRLFSVYIGKVETGPQILPAVMQSERVAFIAFGLVCVVGIYDSL